MQQRARAGDGTPVCNMVINEKPHHQLPGKRRFQFRLGSLFGVVLVLGIPLGAFSYFLNQYRHFQSETQVYGLEHVIRTANLNKSEVKKKCLQPRTVFGDYEYIWQVPNTGKTVEALQALTPLTPVASDGSEARLFWSKVPDEWVHENHFGEGTFMAHFIGNGSAYVVFVNEDRSRAIVWEKFVF